MDEQFFRKITAMIEEAITAYEDLLSLYKEKKQALLKPDKAMLTFVDEKILSQVKVITTLNRYREKFCKRNNVDEVKISKLIEYASKENPELVDVYRAQKVKINEVANELALVEKTNVELIKHSLIMSDKLLDIIISAAAPQTENYDKHGRNAGSNEVSISSIVEEA